MPEKKRREAMTAEEREADKEEKRRRREEKEKEEFEEAYDELAEVEKQRLRNIERNQEMLRALGLL